MIISVSVVLSTTVVDSIQLVGSFSNDDSDGNEDVKKAIGLLSMTNFSFSFDLFLNLSAVPQVIYSREIRLQPTISANWNIRDKV